MKLKLNKNKIKNLSRDKAIFPEKLTPMIAGGSGGGHGQGTSHSCNAGRNPCFI
ncbi:hypothetical protein SG34_002705 [Thalassomonas viridans]|uniref:Uncharacterized protein n=1 Tax=Thalassomonas viridans TaxID=137584 RepID=A0AAF0CAH3_9GAMM|nr:hypothetical protein [Thalassomonas viridans]WDE05864.1 hypothetical protein SG34_002705 [Thalassomonas viridans]